LREEQRLAERLFKGPFRHNLVVVGVSTAHLEIDGGISHAAELAELFGTLSKSASPLSVLDIRE